MNVTQGSGVAREMPRYKSHKQVWALRIRAIDGNVITPEEDGYANFTVSDEYVAKHQPKAGGYYVVYVDGYQSWSPADAFEEGYTLIAPSPLTVGFKVDLAPSGDLNRIQLSKDGAEIRLTLEQAKSLVRELEARLQ